MHGEKILYDDTAFFILRKTLESVEAKKGYGKIQQYGLRKTVYKYGTSLKISISSSSKS